ncbi:type II toxin-antitoxin system PemK/MazF family toxin [Glutamicibacter sp. NPDC087344]|uniref:type II toxin-antitoxin system PemK/MazF family toxin n=1 Tax=Glutamicibacter sp. NPDC087344 TaxID=3363994 RepID=UPI0037F897FB
MALNAQKIFEFIRRTLKDLAAPSAKDSRGTGSATGGGAATRTPPTASAGYPGDYRGAIHYEYSPKLDGDADPGEIVWGWVPYEEDYSQGKDRPVLIIGRDGNWLLGLMLTSKDKNNSQHHNPDYLDIGTGSWDRERRPSEVKLNRIIRLSQRSVRREGAILDEGRFRNVVKVLNGRR